MSNTSLCRNCKNNVICKGFAVQKELYGIAEITISSCTRYDNTANTTQEKPVAATVPIRNLETLAEKIREAEQKETKSDTDSSTVPVCPICDEESKEELLTCSKCGRKVCPGCIMEDVNPDTRVITQVCSECW